MKENHLAPALDSVQFPRNRGQWGVWEEERKGKEECVGVQSLQCAVFLLQPGG